VKARSEAASPPAELEPELDPELAPLELPLSDAQELTALLQATSRTARAVVTVIHRLRQAPRITFPIPGIKTPSVRL